MSWCYWQCHLTPLSPSALLSKARNRQMVLKWVLKGKWLNVGSVAYSWYVNTINSIAMGSFLIHKCILIVHVLVPKCFCPLMQVIIQIIIIKEIIVFSCWKLKWYSDWCGINIMHTFIYIPLGHLLNLVNISRPKPTVRRRAAVRRYFDPPIYWPRGQYIVRYFDPGAIYRNDILTPLTIFWPPLQ